MKKIDLIESVNPEWRDLSRGWYENACTTAKGSFVPLSLP
jgi:hypothetical protein